eukprot:gene18243-24694_t
MRPLGRNVTLGIHRSDYMLDAPSGKFLQVELNTIASSFGCLSSLTTALHRYTCRKAGIKLSHHGTGTDTPAARPASGTPAARLASRYNCRKAGIKDLSSLPDNPALQKIPAAISAAAKATGIEDPVVVMLGLFEEHGLTTLRRSLAEIAETGRVRESDGALMLPGSEAGSEHAVACVYFRAGYTPDDYPSETEWTARELIETSSAAKCPSVAYQLTGAKKIQQDLASPGVLEKFVTAEESSQLQDLFAGLWGLDDLSAPETAAIVAEAMQRPEAFVLKPQREGGGNNLYDEDLVARLKEGNGLSAYILMQKILPPPQRSVLVRNGGWTEAETLSELGIFGTFIKLGEKVLLSEEAGHLVRTKSSNANEGGVAAGFAVLDSPTLV